MLWKKLYEKLEYPVLHNIHHILELLLHAKERSTWYSQ